VRIRKRSISACFFIVMGLTLLLSGQSATGPVDATTLDSSTLQKSAAAGDPQAEYALGLAYDNGQGVAQNDEVAFSWYRKSAEQGYAPAQSSLGLMYRQGRGVEQSKEKAVEWYRKAAKQKFAKAMFNLGTAYYNGDGVAVNDIAAYAWFLLAQQYGSDLARDAVERTAATMQTWQTSSAFEGIGDMYEQGTDLPQDHQIAIDWYRKAAKIGEPPVQVKLAHFLLIQGGEAKQQEALQFCKEAGNKMYSPGSLCAGLLYERGVGTSRNLPEALKWFERSAQWGNAQAMLILGERYWDGTGVKQDRVKAYTYVLLAATGGLPKALEDKDRYERELNAKDMEKGRKQAAEWSKTHPATMHLPERAPSSQPFGFERRSQNP
jgi:uncharacterized protein